jgi:hypothetical protein
MTKKKGFPANIWEKSKEWWPVSIVLMAFTFLSQLDKTMELSAYLSFALAFWREGLQLIIAYVPNLIAEWINWPWRLVSPGPELIFVGGCLFSSFIRNDALNRFSDKNTDPPWKPKAVLVLWPMVILHFLITYTFDRDNTTHDKFLTYILMALSASILFIPVAITYYFMFNSHLLIGINVVVLLLFANYILRSFNIKIMDTAISNFFIIIHAGIISASVLLIAFTYTLEFIIPPSQEFVCNARTRAELKLPDHCAKLQKSKSTAAPS